MDMII